MLLNNGFAIDGFFGYECSTLNKTDLRAVSFGFANALADTGMKVGYTHFPDKFMTNQMDLVQFEF